MANTCKGRYAVNSGSPYFVQLAGTGTEEPMKELIAEYTIGPSAYKAARRAAAIKRKRESV